MGGEGISGNTDAFLVKFAPNGALSYQKNWGGVNDDAASRVTVDANGNAVVAGIVTEAGPYTLATPNLSTATPGFTLATTSFSTATPTGIVGPVSGQVSSPSGSTSYGGFQDVFLFSYGLPDISLTVSANPTAIQAGRSTVITARATSQGNAMANVIVTLSSSAGSFNPASGTTDSNGYFLAIFTSSSVIGQTIVTITATASKTNYNDAIPVSVSLTVVPWFVLSPELALVVVGLVIAAAVTVAAFLTFRKRKRPLPAATPPA